MYSNTCTENSRSETFATSRRRIGLITALALWALVLLTGAMATHAGVDIRTRSPLDSSTTAAFTVHLGDCSNLVSIAVGSGSELTRISPSDARRSLESPLSCEVDFTLDRAASLNPRVELSFLDGSTAEHSESFQLESNPPSLALNSIGIRETGGEQWLDLVLDADDDTDIAYLVVSGVGLRASTLRSVGGVVAEAEATAYVDSEGYRRIYPRYEGQQQYTLSMKLDRPLRADEIASDALMLINASVVDASGNQSSISEISFLGDDVREEVRGFAVSPRSVTFSNALEEIQLVPSLDYQFRGLTPVPGAGRGISYSSSDASKVFVTRDGRVYPLAETEGAPVMITLSYPGLDPLTVPVTVDFSKQLVGLQLEGYGDGGLFELPALNQFFPLPGFLGVFDDGSTAALSSSLRLLHHLPNGADSLLTIDAQRGLRAAMAIPAAQALPLEFSLQQFPEIRMTLPVIATDAVPQLSLEAKGQNQVGSTLTLEALAEPRRRAQRLHQPLL